MAEHAELCKLSLLQPKLPDMRKGNVLHGVASVGTLEELSLLERRLQWHIGDHMCARELVQQP